MSRHFYKYGMTMKFDHMKGGGNDLLLKFLRKPVI